MSHKVEFYYDFSSPYSYLASTRIEAICEKYGARLEWKPFLLGGVYKEAGNRAPLEVPSKLQYLPSIASLSVRVPTPVIKITISNS